jgi:hypothetical protein
MALAVCPFGSLVLISERQFLRAFRWREELRINRRLLVFLGKVKDDLVFLILRGSVVALQPDQAADLATRCEAPALHDIGHAFANFRRDIMQVRLLVRTLRQFGETSRGL